MAYLVGRCLLQKLLDQKDMEQIELAHRLNVKPPQINKYVKGKQRMSIQVAYNIAHILNCHIEDLYEWIEVGDDE
ncbi:helix-turn-helix transcriptional regulator [Virgibacillus sp. C22-A2]|uniref:Helix-turn-helix transcriptional regulator n=1 Tax=Virgibacillus tibetensis TaxID=3042313 RepID=A0ABU6KCW3_9BACI|nr:helix-turn-helix transcriptional regulator [Virgibacillus sp. C22-A2]